MAQVKSKADNKNKKWFLIGLLAFLLFAFKKKPEGVYVPEDGEFGEFDTDGDFDEVIPKNKVSAKSVIGGVAHAVDYDDTVLVDLGNDNSGNCGY